MLLLVGIGVALTLRSAAGQDVTWTVQFGTTGDDEASELTVDGSGHIYVVGSTFGSLPGQTNPGGADAYLRKYGPDANEVWKRQFGTEDFDVARAIVVDVTGNLYLVGSTADTLPGQTSFGNIDAYLKKYDANGVEAWTRQFGSGSFDFGQDVAIDGAGNLYVAGSTWGAHPGETDMGVQDAFVRKYDSDGLEVWTRQFGTIGFDEAASLGVDDAGNVYVTGWTDEALPGQTNAGLGEDAYLRKYDSNGFEIWTRQFGTEGSDLAVGVVVSGDSGVFVAGYTDGALPGQASSGSFDGYLRSYDADGLELWTRQFGIQDDDMANGVAADDASNIYVVGTTEGVEGDDAFIRKYDSNGNHIWTRRFGTRGNDSASSVVVDGAGNLYVAGRVGGPLPGHTGLGGYDVFLRRYDSDGIELWTRQFGTRQDDQAYAVTVDSQGDLYIAGRTGGALPGHTRTGREDAFVVKYNAEGHELWNLQFGSPRSAGDVGAGIDGAGDVYVAGETGGAFPGYAYLGGRNDAFLLKISGVQMSTSPDNTLPKAGANGHTPAHRREGHPDRNGHGHPITHFNHRNQGDANTHRDRYSDSHSHTDAHSRNRNRWLHGHSRRWRHGERRLATAGTYISWCGNARVAEAECKQKIVSKTQRPDNSGRELKPQASGLQVQIRHPGAYRSMNGSGTVSARSTHTLFTWVNSLIASRPISLP